MTWSSAAAHKFLRALRCRDADDLDHDGEVMFWASRAITSVGSTGDSYDNALAESIIGW